MLKVMGQIVRKPDMPLDAFRLHWRTIHRGLALRLAHAGLLRGYVQNHRLDIDVDGLMPIADGVPELWFDDPQAFARLRTSEALLAGAFQDEPRFMDIGRYRTLLLEPESIALAPSRKQCAGLLKLMLFLRADEGEGPLPLADAVRFSTHCRSSASATVPLSGHDRVETSWWRSLEDFASAWARRTRGAPVDGMLVEERPVFWPGEEIPPADWTPVAETRPRPSPGTAE
ncbi:MAG TPA: EthD domain-containing protein [Sphingobium sp.]|nr:EthD domain-containing protein [Sphingobium sp.]